jgi:hypothetical protein
MKEDRISSIANEISSLSVLEFDNLIKECEIRNNDVSSGGD